MNRIKHYLKEIAIFIVVMTVFANIISLYKSSDLNSQKLQLSSVKLVDGKEYSFENDKPILVHYWAIWCPTCVAEASNIELISKYYNVITIAVKSGSNADIKEYLNSNNFSFNVVNDSESIYSSKYNIAAFPTTFIYDKDRNLVFSEVGYTSTIGLFLRMWWAGI